MIKLFLVISCHIVLLFLTRYVAWPENFIWSYLNIHNFSLYKNIFYIYPPLYFILLTEFYKLFGISLISLKIFSYLIIAGTDFLLFFVARRRILPVAIYILLQFSFEGNSVWPDQLIAPLLLLAYLALTSKRPLILGIFLGLALATKQTSAYVIIPIIATLKDRARVLVGIMAPLFAVSVYLWGTRSLQDFANQGLIYVLFYHAENKVQQVWPTIWQTFVVSSVFLPAIVMGISKKRYLLTFIVLTSGLGIFTRFSYFHLQPALPFLAILMSDTESWLSILFAVIFFIRVFMSTFGKEARFLNQDTLSNANIINQYIQEGKKTLILTSSDHYYFLTKTIPIGNFFTTSTPWNLAYPGIEDRIINDLRTEKPRYIVFEKGPEKIATYVLKNYQLVLKLSDGSGIFEYNPMGLR